MAKSFLLNTAPVVQSQSEFLGILQWHDPRTAPAEQEGVAAQFPDQVQVVTSSHEYRRVLGGNSMALVVILVVIFE